MDNKIILEVLKKVPDTIITSIDITFTSTFLDNWKNLNNLWAVCFMDEGKDFSNLKNKVIAERFRYAKILKIFWQEIIKEYKENLISTKEYNEKENVMASNFSDNDHFISIKNQSISNSSHSRKNIEIPSYSTENNSKNSQLINFLL
ncbi:unnamed protein product [Rhizophagus irregularis]|nr:unnamed protein product [Rhizophagus irregularis]